MNKVLFSKESDHWTTPKKLYDALIENGFIDPCPLYSSYDTPLETYHKKKLFINPPFSEINKWVDYAINQFKNGNIIYLLIPSRTDTKYFHRMLNFYPSIYFIKGRLKFNEKGSAPFPSIMIIFDKMPFTYDYGDLERLILWIKRRNNE